MPDKPILRFRFAVAEWPWFTKRDSVEFRVNIDARSNAVSFPVNYFEAADLAAARAEMHKLVDAYFDGKAHMEQLEAMVDMRKAAFESEMRDLKQVTELTIARSSPKPTAPKTSVPDSGLLDFTDETLFP